MMNEKKQDDFKPIIKSFSYKKIKHDKTWQCGRDNIASKWIRGFWHISGIALAFFIKFFFRKIYFFS